MLGQRGFAATPISWHLMLASGVVMIAVFIYVASRPYPALQHAVETGDWKAGGVALNHIRRMVGANLILGVVTTGFATLGRYFN